MLFVLDAYNVIGKLKLKDGDLRRSFLRYLLRHPISFSKRNRIVVVFDGPRNPDIIFEFPMFEIIFSGKETADVKIKYFLERYRPSAGIVVSDDREVRFYAHRAGIRSVSVGEFLSWEEEDDDEEGFSDKELSEEEKREINEELEKLWLRRKES